MHQFIQANIKGYKGDPVSLFSVYDTDTGILSIAKQTRYSSEKKPKCLLITNDAKENCRDLLFSEDDFKASIRAFNWLENGLAADKVSKRLQIDSSVNFCNPNAVIDLDKLEESGPKYRLDPEMTNSHAACLASCFYAARVNSVRDSIWLAQELERTQKLEYLYDDDELYGFITV